MSTQKLIGKFIKADRQKNTVVAALKVMLVYGNATQLNFQLFIILV